MSFKNRLTDVILSALRDMELKDEDISVLQEKGIRIEYPDRAFGDYATPVAMQLAKILKKSPVQIGEELTSKLTKNEIFSKVDLVKPGFINFTLSNSIREQAVKDVSSAEKYGSSDKYKDKSILIEFVSANPTGPLHIGHGRWAAIGDVLGNVLEYAGYRVEREFYVNDAGSQIENLKKTIKCLRSGEAVPEDGYHGQYMDVFKDIDDDPVEYFLAGHKKTLDQINTIFDTYFSEQKLRSQGSVEKMFEVLKDKDMSYEKDGALWFRSTAFGDEKDRVLQKSDGAFSYFGVDIAYHYNKIQRGFTTLINVLGADHHGYLNRIKAAVRLLSDEKVDLLVVLGQLVNLFRDGEPVRMSKRTGDIITLQEVLDDIGTDATRYFLTMRSANSPLDFDLEIAKRTNSDNPVYYIQYAHARIASIFRKAGEEDVQMVASDDFDYGLLASEITDQMVFLMLKFSDEVIEMAASYEIHHLNNYLYELATLFHRFYNGNKIVDSENKIRSANLLFFIKNIQKVIAAGLDLLGIDAPEQM